MSGDMVRKSKYLWSSERVLESIRAHRYDIRPKPRPHCRAACAQAITHLQTYLAGCSDLLQQCAGLGEFRTLIVTSEHRSLQDVTTSTYLTG